MAVTGVMKKREQDAALASMAPELRKERDIIAKLLAEGEKNDVLNKWEIGKHVGRVKVSKKWGEGAVKQVAESLGVGASTLDSYHRLAVAWPEKGAITKLLSQRMTNGHSLGLTHLLAIAVIDSEKGRQKLLKATLAEALTKEELYKRVQNLRPTEQGNRRGKGGKGKGNKSLRPVSPRAGLQQAQSVMKTIQEREKVLTDVFGLLKESAPADWSNDLISDVEATLQEVTAAEGSLHMLKASLTEALERGEKVLSLRKRKDKSKGKSQEVVEDEDEDEEEDDDLDAEAEIEEEASAQDDDDDDDDVTESPVAEDDDVEDDDDDEDDDVEASAEDDDAELADDDLPPRPAKVKARPGGSGKAAAAIAKARKKKKMQRSGA